MDKPFTLGDIATFASVASFKQTARFDRCACATHFYRAEILGYEDNGALFA